ncbi:MAG: acyl-CoA thioesterase [Candidatus Koribacter versatilis]|uniref:Acyl-CoA thioesterase n=1 Tax=Candidatus Korobacter versatilis TaxID=658062 RepID=A0A932EPV8_9BACT|nr:acyl-CoA thioesterase [Candidatus Koribacter versatilis]
MNASVITGETRFRVRYAETDQMGVVYHSNFIVWFEVGRVELLRQLGFRYRDMEEQDDCHIAVVDLRLRYKAPAHYDDEVVIRARLKNMRESLLHFSYEIVRAADNTLLAEGETTHIVVNSKFEKTQLPEKYRQAFAAAVDK